MVFCLTASAKSNEEDSEDGKTEDKEKTIEDDETDKDKENEQPLADEVLEVLGEDPLSSKALKIKIHSSFLDRWAYWSKNGIDSKDRDELLARYERHEKFGAPSLNLEVSAGNDRTPIARSRLNFKSRQQMFNLKARHQNRFNQKNNKQ